MFVLLILLLPGIALAAPSTFAELMALIVSYMNGISQLLVLATIVVYLGSAALHIWKSKDDTKKNRTFLLWGIAIIFVMVSVWGILRLLQNTLASGGNDLGAGQTQTFCLNLDECDNEI
jgi:fumarate reductase subunit D